MVVMHIVQVTYVIPLMYLKFFNWVYSMQDLKVLELLPAVTQTQPD